MEKFISIESLFNNYLIIFGDHAIDEMNQSEISEEEVENCIEFGELVIKQTVKGEMRYGKQISFKNKTIIVIYTYENDEEKIVTVYPIRRKKWQT